MAVCEKIKDSEGYTITIGKYKRQNGEEITHAPEFEYIGHVLDNLDKIKLTGHDVILTSYPKSGSNWMYEILTMLQRGKASPAEKLKSMDFMERAKSIEQLNNTCDSKIINTHVRPKYLSSTILSNTKIVHVARNPKSAAVSYYFHIHNAVHHEYEGTFNSYLPTYLEGYHTIYGNWFEAMQEWWDVAQTHPNICFLFYEDLKKDPVKEISKLSRFLGYDYSSDFIQDVANMTTFEKMKAEVGKNEEAMRVAASMWKDGKRGLMRKGTIQDWKNHFTVAQNEMFDAVYEDKMKHYPELKARIQFE